MADIEVKNEPFTYTRHGRHSYMLDRIAAHGGDNEAAARLERHAREMDAELEQRDRASARALAAAQEPGGPLEGVEFRANPNRTQGQGGYFAPPIWLTDQFAGQPRARRVLAGLTPTLPLPQGVQQVNLPRIVTGAIVGVDPDLGSTPGEGGITDTVVTSVVAPIVGTIDPALQMVERAPGAYVDYTFFRDLREAYDATLEQQLIAGTGSNAQLLGLLNVPSGANGRNAVTYTDATPTGPEGMPFLGQMVAQIGDARNLPPEAWLMRTARWAWLSTAEDTATMPFLPPGMILGASAPPRTPDGQPDACGFLIIAPVFPDDAIPANTGAASNQDAIIACRPSDNLLLESDERTSVNIEPLSGTMQVRLQLRGYAAHMVRQPTGISTLTGSGMIVQSGF